MGQIPRSTERISSILLNYNIQPSEPLHSQYYHYTSLHLASVVRARFLVYLENGVLSVLYPYGVWLEQYP